MNPLHLPVQQIDLTKRILNEANQLLGFDSGGNGDEFLIECVWIHRTRDEEWCIRGSFVFDEEHGTLSVFG